MSWRLPLGMLAGRGGAVSDDLTGQVFRDKFTTAIDPITTPRTAEPGTGTWTVAGSLWKVVSGALRGGGQGSPTWGSSRLVHATGLSRVAGRTLVAYVIPEDSASDLAIGWATGVVADPRTDGHSWLLENGTLQVAAPSKKVVIGNGSRVLRPMEYLVIVALNGTGATYLISAMGADTAATGGSNDRVGIPAYPSARVLWVDDAATTATMYPVISAYDTQSPVYPNQTFIDDLRVLDVSTWTGDHPLATLVDRFAGGNSASSMGAGWSVSAGTTWGISSNKAYCVTRSGFSFAYKASGLNGNGIWKFKLTTDSASVTTNFGCVIRVVDTSNYVRCWNNGNANLFTIQTWVAGGFDNTIANYTFAWTVNTTYDIVIMCIDGWYKVWIDGTELKGSDVWDQDANNRHPTGDGFGPFLVSDGTSTRWDDFVAIPHTVTLPAQLQTGAVPAASTVGSTQITDTFTSANGTRLNVRTTDTGGATYTEGVGTWTVQSNKATVSAAAGDNYATVPEVTTDYEVSVDVTMPAVFTTNTIRAGVVLKTLSTTDRLIVRLYKDAGTCEIEILQVISGSGAIVHKADLTASGFLVNTTYTLKVQIVTTSYGQRLRVFLGGLPRVSFICSATFTGTGVGLYRENIDDGCVFDGLTIKALT